MVVDINIQGLSYAKNSTVCMEFPMRSKFNFWPVETIFFPITYLINSSTRGNGIYLIHYMLSLKCAQAYFV